jgi:hypothetical protein
LYYGAQPTHSSLYEDSVEVSYGQPPTVQGSSPPRSKSVAPSMKPLSLCDLEDDDRDDSSPMDKAMRSLVHLDDISKPIETSPQELKSRQLREAVQQHKKSKPQPPRREPFLRMDASIGEIQSHATQTTRPTKQVMRVHPAQALDPATAPRADTMMVRYGAPPPPQYYAPQPPPQYQQHQAMYAGY